MVKQNQGFRKDLNLFENVNDTQTLSNLGGPGIANDLRIIQNNLRNISTVGYSSLSNGYFFFGSNNIFAFTNDDVVTVSTNVDISSSPIVYTGTTTELISETYNGYPVRGYLYYPTSLNVGSSVDVLVLYHPTITTIGVSPFSAALNFLNIVKDNIKIQDKIIFSVAYPQDDIPLWNNNPTLPAQQFPGLDYPNFYFGDNIVYAEAALLWVKNNLNTYLSSNSIPKTINKVFTFGHSQGAYLTHRLNTMHSVSGGVISNAPGPIDLLQVCSVSEANSDSNPTCSKIKNNLGSTSTNPNTYNSRSLKNYLSSCPLSPALFTQALDDTTGNSNGSPQVTNMQTIVQPALSSCSSVTFNYYATGGHAAFVTNPDVQRDIRNFVGSIFEVLSTLTSAEDYYVCNSDGKTRFKLSTTPSVVGFNTVNVVSVSTTSFYFIRKDPVTQDNIFNFLKPEIQDDQFSYINGGSINNATGFIQNNLELAKYLIDRKYKGNADTSTNNNISIEGSVNIEDPAKLNTGTAGLQDPKSPGVFIGDVRAFSSDNNPWTKVGTALSTLSNSVSIGELYFSNDISISGVSTESASQVAVTSFSHKIPVVINGETYYILLST